jgi:hypothetical protein
VEQILYSPVAITGFYGGMTLLENKSFKEAIEEVKNKYWPTFRVSFAVNVIHFIIIQAIYLKTG